MPFPQLMLQMCRGMGGIVCTPLQCDTDGHGHLLERQGAGGNTERQGVPPNTELRRMTLYFMLIFNE